MRVNRSRIGFALTLLASLFMPSEPPRACFDPPPFPVFVPVLHPDHHFNDFAAGRLGIIHPTYARSYLVVAFRYLNGGAFTTQQQAQLCRLWEDRLVRTWDSETAEWRERWVNERAKITSPAVPEEIERYLKKGDRWIFDGISADAFHTALATLEDRRRRYGDDSPTLRLWLEAQDLVFSGKRIPDALPESASPAERADRAYQIAAAKFYKGEWGEAEQLFAAIAKDSSSPWAKLAPYLVARTAFRVATWTTKDRPEPDLVALDTCDALLGAILGDPDLSSTHSAARRLRFQILLIRSPEQALSTLDAALRSGIPSDAYQDLWDYTVLLNRRLWCRSWETAPQLRPGEKEFSEAAPTRALGELSDWLVTFQSEGPNAARHALEMWRSRQTAPWLVASLAKAEPSGQDTQELMEAASRVAPDSPAFVTAQYHRARLLLGRGMVKEARSLLDGLLALPEKDIRPSSRNQLLSARLATASTFEEFLGDLSRKPASICLGYRFDEEIPLALAPDWDESSLPPDSDALIDADGAQLLNHVLPLRLLVQAARSPLLPTSVRKRLAIASWTRAVLLERDQEALESGEVLAQLYPHLAKDLRNIACEEPGESRRNSAIFLLSRTPGLTPVVIHGVGRWNPIWRLNIWGANWWCTGAEPSSGAEGNEETHYMFDPGDGWASERLPIRAVPPFLTDRDRSEAQQEMRLIADLGLGSTYVARNVLAWALAHPEDSRVPEALHHACEALHYGECRGDEQTAQLYQTIRKRLYSRYKDTQWNRTAPW